MLRDRLVCGIADNVIQKRLLAEDPLTLTKALDISKGMESAAKMPPLLVQIMYMQVLPKYTNLGSPQQTVIVVANRDIIQACANSSVICVASWDI